MTVEDKGKDYKSLLMSMYSVVKLSNLLLFY